MRHTVDRENGGFYGRSTAICGSTSKRRAPRLSTRGFYGLIPRRADSTATHYREMADWAYDYIVDKFWDAEYGGIYWMLDYLGHPISDRKQIYAQAFAAYAMAEYFRATGNPESLELREAALPPDRRP